ncbi:uncharacterized protein DSM5745_07822 [Aspergillus mulundensis]|uniref:Roadblock/LAMTOR2 domain-containing protein n=1 Tax=Aspergillus mulundensis TaxID=1810919 RepID=A0A3D8RFB1_9EURO|nr:Uncharacterized protein DSM5745_07822 [Aspergillus mulundensis]RDW72650.1 Uncharacterized protein DSM5745_07822 [Aspergillus mulundensis]
MASSTTSPQIPQHVSALLSHLTSRPGVQSTLILSRKDGSIIQTTGLLAPPKRPSVTSEASAPVPAPGASEDAGPATDAATSTDTTTTTDTETPSTETESQLQSATSTSTQTQTQAQSKPYQPTQAESLAAHIFAFVSSASNLSLALANPLDGKTSSANGVGETGLVNGTGGGTGTGEGEGEGSEGLDDDEVKLMRLRTKKHEVVVVPDRKYLLCVVQDATPTAAGSGGLATGAGRFSR